jgi:hypothetical protein
MFPDLILTSSDKAHRFEGLIEVETGESVNHLEAMAQWAHFGRAKAPFHLYVPASAIDIARRLCLENNVSVSEIWSYHSLGDQTRFTLVTKTAQKPSPAAEPVKPKPAAKPNGAARTKEAPSKPVKPKARPKAAASQTKKKRRT